MTFSLYDATVPTYLQLLKGTMGYVAKAEEYCAEQGVDPATLLDARLIEDMEPFAFQIKAVAMHSRGAIDAVREGSFSPDPGPYPEDFPAVRERLEGAIAALEALDADEINGWTGNPMQFKLGEMVMPFTAEGFLMSFALPNFQFHTTTAYALLRAKGVPIGKIDYLGPLQIAAG